MKRPASAPARIPAWAWLRDKWLSTTPAKRGPRPGPSRLPAWFWAWRVWRHKTPWRKPPPPTPAPKPAAPFTMYDSITLSEIPKDAAAVAGYVNGRWPTWWKLPKLFPHAMLLSIAVTASADAECLDVEPGDARIDQAATWLRRQQKRGIRRPVVYTSVSQAAALIAALNAAGIGRGQYRLWTAHYTYRPHRCSRSCGFGFTGVADATQYTNHADGRVLDASLCAPTFLKETL